MMHKFQIWNHIKRFNYNSILISNFLLILIVIILPLTCMFVYFYNSYNKSIETEMHRANNQLLSQIRSNMDIFVSEIDKTSYSFAADDYVRTYVLSKDMTKSSQAILQRTQYIRRIMDWHLLSNANIHSTYIYSKNNNYVISNVGNNKLNEFSDNEWIDSYLQNQNSKPSWIQLRNVANIKGTFNTFLSFFYVIKPYTESEGVIITNVSIDVINNMISTVDKRLFNEMIITEANGNIVFCRNSEFIGKSINAIPYLANLSTTENLSKITTVKKSKVLLCMEKSDFNDWNYYSVFSMDNYNKSTRIKNMFFLILLSIMGLILSVILSYIISIKIFNPIENLISIIDRPDDWINTKSISSKNSFNEFKYIATYIFNSISSKKTMEDELANRLSAIKKAQAAALQSQINPHFLFNTLDTIYLMSLSQTNGENAVSNMIASLADLLRLNMETKDHFISISEEIEYTHIYLDIQKIRYGNKFNVIWNVDTAIINHKIIKLTIQPLIENSIYHGAKPINKCCEIIVNGYMMDNNVVLEISDNGKGMSEERLQYVLQILDYDDNKQETHIGLSNVNTRLRLMFGEQYEIDIKSKLNAGTTITLVFPAV